MSSKTAAIIGATGLTGSHLLDLLLRDSYFETVRVIVRRPIVKSNAKTEIKLVDFDDMESLKLALEDTDVIFCCIGTTRKKSGGNKAQYRRVDFDIPIHAARMGKETGCEKFIFVSSVGANSQSNNFYLRLKGETENNLKALKIAAVHIMRPSILLGRRKDRRPLERIGQFLLPAISFLLPDKYKPIHAMEVAAAMLNAAKKEEKGVIIYEFSEIRKMAASR